MMDKTLEHRSSLRAAKIPPRAGAGLKPEHYQAILSRQPNVGFFEIHAENYMGAGGAPHAFLTRIREHYPLSLHGVGLSIGGAGPLDADHLARLVAVERRYQPGLVSEHLAWSTHDGVYYNDLLPLPYDAETLQKVCDHIDEVQAALRRPMLLENPATYIEFAQSTMSETEFLRAIARRTGCGLLLDISNVAISSANHRRDARAYLADFPLDLVGEIHLSGYATEDEAPDHPLLIDTHGACIPQPVWALTREVIARNGPTPILIEWDNDVPDWPVLFADVQIADRVLDEAAIAFRPAPRRAAAG